MITSMELTSTLLRTNSVIERSGEPLIEYQSTNRSPFDRGGTIEGVPVSLLNQIYLATLSYQNILYILRDKLKEIEDANASEANEVT